MKNMEGQTMRHDLQAARTTDNDDEDNDHKIKFVTVLEPTTSADVSLSFWLFPFREAWDRSFLFPPSSTLSFHRRFGCNPCTTLAMSAIVEPSHPAYPRRAGRSFLRYRIVKLTVFLQFHPRKIV